MEKQSEFKKIEELIRKCIERLYKEDEYLIIHNLCERTLVFRFGIYMYELMKEDNLLKNYYLDNEYNRNVDDIKATRHYPKGRYVDMIIHNRGKNGEENNILAIEFKRNRVCKEDRKKIDDLIDKEGLYKYKYGFTITFKKDGTTYYMRSQKRPWSRRKVKLINKTTLC